MSISLPDVDLIKNEESNAPLDGASILVVDEDPAFALGLKTFLKEYVGYKNVQTAKGGADALKMLEDDKTIEIVTLDYQMPGMNGIEVLRRLNAEPPHPMSVLMITGYPSDELEDEFRKLGNKDILTTHFIAKPVDFEELEPLILGSHEELTAARRLAAKMAEEEARKAAEAEAEAAKQKEEEAAKQKQADDSIPPLDIDKTDRIQPTGMMLQDPTGPISPIAAAALLAQRDPTEPVPIIETVNPEISAKLEEMSAKMAHMENEVNRMNAKTPTVQERFWLDVLKVAAVAMIGFIGYQFGVFDRIANWINPETADEQDIAVDGDVQEAAVPQEPSIVEVEPDPVSAPAVEEPEVTEEPVPEPEEVATPPSTAPVEEPQIAEESDNASSEIPAEEPAGQADAGSDV